MAIVAFLVSGSFLLALVPERSSKAAVTPIGATSLGAAAAPIAPPPAPVGGFETPAPPTSPEAAADLGQGSFGPLGGAGGPPRRPARHLPVEQGGATHFLAVEEIVAVHANAHYTTVYDGERELFCPLSIGEVEQRLDAAHFLRVHRSHIVNLSRITGLKRAGDNGVIELAGRARLYGAGQPQPLQLAEGAAGVEDGTCRPAAGVGGVRSGGGRSSKTLGNPIFRRSPLRLSCRTRDEDTGRPPPGIPRYSPACSPLSGTIIGRSSDFSFLRRCHLRLSSFIFGFHPT